MSADISAVLNSYINQLTALLARVEQLKHPSRRQGSREAGKVIGGIAGAVGEDMFESKAAGKVVKGIAERWVAESDRQAYANQERLAETEFHQILENIDSYLSTISIMSSRLKLGGNSQRLKKRMARCFGGARIETRIRRAIQVLYGIKSEPLVRNLDIQAAIDKMNTDEQGTQPYETLRRLETGLRSFIAGKLGALTPDWWNMRIPPDVRERAEERMKRNKRLWPWQDEASEAIQYVDFADYVKIITRRDNWDDVFVHVFKDKEVISGKLKELDPIRNDIAHSRKLSSHRLRKLQVYTQDLLGAIEKA